MAMPKDNEILISDLRHVLHDDCETAAESGLDHESIARVLFDLATWWSHGVDLRPVYVPTTEDERES